MLSSQLKAIDKKSKTCQLDKVQKKIIIINLTFLSHSFLKCWICPICRVWTQSQQFGVDLISFCSYHINILILFLTLEISLYHN